ncbi:hypothetical protein UC34_04920 [Pandoraea vervacti]|uniref:Uncharacterized protein n=1 Tax=Pandoraea vervacti TaxID=656178 RepID=A0ABN4FLY8_9BURK|nr:hypothetical protein UC34_04920 [Pandoraea vervacti]
MATRSRPDAPDRPGAPGHADIDEFSDLADFADVGDTPSDNSSDGVFALAEHVDWHVDGRGTCATDATSFSFAPNGRLAASWRMTTGRSTFTSSYLSSGTRYVDR